MLLIPIRNDNVFNFVLKIPNRYWEKLENSWKN